MKVKGVILAGGEGTRFRPLTYYFQKCMIPVGEEQRPVLEYIVRLFRYHDIKELVLLVGYKHQQIRNYFDDGSRFKVKISYVLDKPEMKGSANALVNAYESGAISEEDCLITYYGDILSNIDLRSLVKQHLESGASATVALAYGFRIRVGMAEVLDGWIKGFTEKPTLKSPVSIGILALQGEVLSEMEILSKERASEGFDLMRDFIPYLLEAGHPVGAYITDAFWYDMGSLERYERFENQHLSRELSFLFESEKLDKETPKR
jgi:mannose-1-phosphate guanylyltransferase